MPGLNKANIEDIFPMSAIQQGMVFHAAKDDSSSTYHDQSLFVFTDTGFDFGLFRKTVCLMIDKHPMLRTVFNLADYKEPVQIVLKQIGPDISYQYPAGLDSKEARQEFIAAAMAADRANPFDLETGMPLWRMKIVQTSPAEVCLLWLFHHAIFDGWSTSCFITELHQVYHTLKAAPGFVPAPLRSSYKIYVMEQLAFRRSEEHREFWKKELAGYKRYALKNKIDEADLQGFVLYAEDLDTALLHQLREQSRQQNIPVKIICLAAYLYTLKLLSYENELLIGVMSNNRPVCDDAEKILGCFLNSIPFRVTLAAPATWLQVMQQVDRQRNILSAYEQLSFFEIVKLFSKDTTDQNPFFDVTFDFVDFNRYQDFRHQITDEYEYLSDLSFEKTNALLDLMISTTLDRFQVFISYATPLLTPERIAQIAAWFRRILEKMAYDPQGAIRHEDLYDTTAVQQLTGASNNDHTGMPAPDFVALFEQQVQASPMKTAIADDQLALSYTDLNRYANKIAHALLSRHARREDLVILYFNRGSFLLASMIGVLKAGAAFVAIDTETPAERLKYMVANSHASIILSEETLAPRLRDMMDNGYQEIIVVADGKALSTQLSQQPEHNPGISLLGDQTAYVIYTSGSTGTPKGVVLHHAGLSNHLTAVVDFLALTANDVMAQTASCNFDVSIMQFLLCLTVGGKTVVFNKQLQLQPALFVTRLAAEKITLAELVPSHIDAILNASEGGLANWHSLKYLLSTGEVLTERTVRKWYQAMPYIPLVNAYGPAEASDDVTLYIVQPGDQDPLPVGKPLPNIQVYIIDQNHQLSPPGITGEIAIAGTAVGKGYWNEPALTQASFINNPFSRLQEGNNGGAILYKTGDLGYWTEAGELVVKGRVGNMVKIRGNRIELSEIEKQLEQVPGILQAVVADRLVNEDTVLCAYYTTDRRIGADDIRNKLLAFLPGYMLPSYYIELKTLPLLPSGKIDRATLPPPAYISDETPETAEAFTDMEEVILKVWKEVLNQPGTINLKDNFFDIGGHSLSMIMVNNKLNKALSRSVPVVQLFRYPTIRSLAQYLAKEAAPAIPQDNMKDAVQLMDDAIAFFSQE
ncbi:non-ribosomal peptide synthetase [Paraflavitalea soli]|uniref:Non-ribosomal peptide synthetase n=1 Tax=Paraflavitalea soli TaxID=2315862 RepID=A0A3B7MK62_9BACT|nr:non-ribosomal peptide synthetase [Paraflavitalea soli]AXY73693.1 non-ribosomal peptide synthetase [Paraflavitalea soli]